MTNYNSSARIREQESVSVEFKTSLFFRAGTSSATEEQMDVITRTIGSMMNMDGGTLYIGVNDGGYVTHSITNEYQYMNAFSPYSNNHYSENQDGYKRFITDWVAKNLGSFATTLVSFEFQRYEGTTICLIHIKKSKVPVWFKQTALFARTDASTRQLRGNDITSFIAQIDLDDLDSAEKNDLDAFEKRLAKIKAKEAPNGKILVVYPNGDYIHESKNVRTMLNVIHRAGTLEVRKLGLAARVGRGNTPSVPFIGDNVYLDNAEKGGKTQAELDNQLVFVKYSVGDIVNKLTQISNGLGLHLHTEVY